MNKTDINKSNYNIIVILISLGTILVFLYSIRNILFPFIISGILAYIINPIISYLHALGLKRIFAIFLIYIILAITLLGGIILFIPNIIDEINIFQQNIPVYSEKINKNINKVNYIIESKIPFIKRFGIIKLSTPKIGEFFLKEISELPIFLGKFFSIFTLIIIIPFITFFFLLNSNKVIEHLIDLIPSKYIETSLAVFWEIDEMLQRFIIGQVMETMFVAIFSIVGLLILDIKYAVIIGLIAGLFNLIPYLGPITGTIIGCLVALIQYGSFILMIKIIILFIFIQFIDNNFIQPFVISRNIKMSPVIVLFAIMAGAEIYGIIGMLLAVPIASIFKVLIDIFIKRRNLLSLKTI